ncbi:MAG: hypothetical protein A2668_02900 [Candidatus Doudnabacteria bacterium RIFCSPHIGHO2_01_FULL_48_180]|nr:MAG: hypothetical protein A2668_02900 [Candidatus Doudnabacteria bacterium RIFCSPHIGHO2_01_FULL_48_180]
MKNVTAASLVVWGMFLGIVPSLEAQDHCAVFAHWAHGGIGMVPPGEQTSLSLYRSELILVNAEQSPADVAVSFFGSAIDADIESMDALGNRTSERRLLNNAPTSVAVRKTVTIKTVGTIQDILSGWAKVCPLGEKKVVPELVIYYANGTEEFTTSVPPSDLLRAFTIIAEFKRDRSGNPSKSTGVALANPGAVPSYVNLTLVDEAGNVLNPSPRKSQLQPSGRIVGFVHEDAWFADLLAGRQEFRGILRVTTPEAPTAALAVGFVWQPSGRYTFYASKPLPGEYMTQQEKLARSIQPVVFVPKGVVVSKDESLLGMQVRIGEVIRWWTDAGALSGQNLLTGITWLPPFFMEGEQTREFYENELYDEVTTGKGTRMGSVVAEVRERFPDQRKLFIAHNVMQVGYGGSDAALVPGPDTRTNLGPASTWRDFAYLQQFMDTVDPQSVRFGMVASVLNTDIHEFGHMMGLPHTEFLSEANPLAMNVMSNKQTSDMGFKRRTGVICKLFPSIPCSGIVSIDSREVATVISLQRP